MAVAPVAVTLFAMTNAPSAALAPRGRGRGIRRRGGRGLTWTIVAVIVEVYS